MGQLQVGRVRVLTRVGHGNLGGVRGRVDEDLLPACRVVSKVQKCAISDSYDVQIAIVQSNPPQTLHNERFPRERTALHNRSRQALLELQRDHYPPALPYTHKKRPIGVEETGT